MAPPRSAVRQLGQAYKEVSGGSGFPRVSSIKYEKYVCRSFVHFFFFLSLKRGYSAASQCSVADLARSSFHAIRLHGTKEGTEGSSLADEAEF